MPQPRLKRADAAPKVVCLISPVFPLMLKGSFQEATDFSSSVDKQAAAARKGRKNAVASSSYNGSYDDSYIQDLPEDDVDAMTALIAVCHFRPLGSFNVEDSEGDAGVPGAVLLETLAPVCDKYQCNNALRAVCNGWTWSALDSLKETYFSPYLGGEEQSSGLLDSLLDEYMAGCSRLIICAFAADLPKTNSIPCWEIVKRHIGPISDSPHESGDLVGKKPKNENSVPKQLLHHPLSPKDLSGKTLMDVPFSRAYMLSFVRVLYTTKR